MHPLIFIIKKVMTTLYVFILPLIVDIFALMPPPSFFLTKHFTFMLCNYGPHLFFFFFLFFLHNREQVHRPPHVYHLYVVCPAQPPFACLSHLSEHNTALATSVVRHCSPVDHRQPTTARPPSRATANQPPSADQPSVFLIPLLYLHC